MNQYLWNIVRVGEPKAMEWYFIRDAKRRVVAGPSRKAVAVTISAAHNDVVMAMMEAINEAAAPRVRYEGMGA